MLTGSLPGFRTPTIRTMVWLALGTALLAGCGVAATPSESDAKANLDLLIKDCPMLSLRDFRKINGVEQPDGSYRVSVAYTLRSTPPAESQRQWAAYQPLKEAQLAKVKACEDGRNVVLKEFQALAAKRWNMFDHASPEYRENEARIQAVEQRLDATRRECDTIADAGRAVLGNEPRLKKELTDAYFAACRAPSGRTRVMMMSLLHELFGGDRIDGFGEEREKRFEGDWVLIKTDNGWRMPELVTH